jgi:mono/diheme cytochrome c family protein
MKPLALVSALLMLAACSRSSANSLQTTEQAGITPEVETMFTNRCTPCHGTTGHGDGSGAAALNPKPRNYTDVAWQKSVTDEQIKKTILYGGAAVGKSPSMPANPDLDGKPELDGLVAKVRSFGGK